MQAPFERASFFQNRGLKLTSGKPKRAFDHPSCGRSFALYCCSISIIVASKTLCSVLSNTLAALYSNCIHRGNLRLLAFFSFICHLAFPIKYLIVEFSSLKKLSRSFASQGFQQVFPQAGMRACGPVSHRMRLIAMSHKVAALHNQYYAILRLSKNVGKTFCLEERAI